MTLTLPDLFDVVTLVALVLYPVLSWTLLVFLGVKRSWLYGVVGLSLLHGITGYAAVAASLFLTIVSAYGDAKPWLGGWGIAIALFAAWLASVGLSTLAYSRRAPKTSGGRRDLASGWVLLLVLIPVAILVDHDRERRAQAEAIQFREAVRQGDLTTLDRLITRVHAAHRTDALSQSAYDGQTAVVARLLDAGVNPEGRPVEPNRSTGTPLMAASKRCHTEVVDLLLRAGARVNVERPAGNNGDKALDLAVQMRPVLGGPGPSIPPPREDCLRTISSLVSAGGVAGAPALSRALERAFSKDDRPLIDVLTSIAKAQAMPDLVEEAQRRAAAR